MAYDVTTFAAHLPPQNGVHNHGMISRETMRWVEEKCDETGGRSTIIVGVASTANLEFIGRKAGTWW
eukprot:1565875-Pyramimonas_sp.AAC.1